MSGLGRHLSLPGGYYSALHILTLLGFMALARIRRPEGLRHVPPGELGKTVGLDWVPEARTLRGMRAANDGSPPRQPLSSPFSFTDSNTRKSAISFSDEIRKSELSVVRV